MITNVIMKLLCKKGYILKIFTNEMMSGIAFKIIQVGGKGECGVETKQLRYKCMLIH